MPPLPYIQGCSIHSIDGPTPNLSSEPHSRESVGGMDSSGASGNSGGGTGNDKNNPGKVRRNLIKAHTKARTSRRSGGLALLIVNDDRNCHAAVIVSEQGQRVIKDWKRGFGAKGGVAGGELKIESAATIEYQSQMSNQFVVLEPGTQRGVS